MGAEQTKPTGRIDETNEGTRLQPESRKMADVSFGEDAQYFNPETDLNPSTSMSKQDCFTEIQAVRLLLKRKQVAPIYATQYGEAAVEEARGASQQASQSAMIARFVAQMSDIGDLDKTLSVDGANWAMAKRNPVSGS